jgi:hypothetical protein
VTTRRLLVVPALVVGALVAQAGLASPAHAAGPRYASPTGTSAQNCLTAATACNIEKAFSGSTSSNDEIILAPGTYTTATVLSRTQTGINVHGIPGQPRPVLVTVASPGLSLTGAGSKVSDLAIQHSGGLWGLNVFATNITVQRVDVRSSGPVACGLGISGVVRDSLCVSTASGGTALDDSWSGDTGKLVLRNVTAVATGAGSYGITADSDGSNTNLDVDGRNVIASGVTADVRSTLKAGSTNQDSDVVLQNSNYDATTVGTGGFVTPPGTGTNQKTAPLFSDASYHQAPGSPTINAGATDVSTGTLDVDGEARPYQGLMDIGADEFYPDVTPPDTILGHGPKHRSHKRKAVFVFGATEPASFVCRLDKTKQVACTSPFKKRLKRYGKHKITITAIDASGNVDPSPVVYTWKIKKKKHRHRP